MGDAVHVTPISSLVSCIVFSLPLFALWLMNLPVIMLVYSMIIFWLLLSALAQIRWRDEIQPRSKD